MLTPPITFDYAITPSMSLRFRQLRITLPRFLSFTLLSISRCHAIDATPSSATADAITPPLMPPITADALRFHNDATADAATRHCLIIADDAADAALRRRQALPPACRVSAMLLSPCAVKHDARLAAPKLHAVTFTASAKDVAVAAFSSRVEATIYATLSAARFL
jgi:hypothetical protein